MAQEPGVTIGPIPERRDGTKAWSIFETGWQPTGIWSAWRTYEEGDFLYLWCVFHADPGGA